MFGWCFEVDCDLVVCLLAVWTCLDWVNGFTVLLVCSLVVGLVCCFSLGFG